MQGYRFFAVMPEARKSKSASKANPFDPWTVARLREKAADGFTCDLIAVDLDEQGKPLWQGSTLNMDATAPAFEGNPYTYQGCGVSRDYLAKRATRIPEALARQLSPLLFQNLES
jgi:hypothetical protein